MNPQLRSVSKHMLGLGMGALAHANWHANYTGWFNDYWPELSVLQAAHAAEIIIKARIAEEHPLLIFEDVPNSSQVQGDQIEMLDLVEQGRTFSYHKLPDRLWATTGIRLPNVDLYKEFGKVRNTLQHFAPPQSNGLGDKTIEFIYGVIDPFIYECWNRYAVDYDEDDDPYVNLIGNLVRREVLFLVSRKAARGVEKRDLEWPDSGTAYRAEMERRFDEALNEVG